MKNKVCAAAVLTLAIATTGACGGGGDGAGGAALTAHGPIKVWLSNNPEEIAWGKSVVTAWNTAHPTETVTAQEIPAGKTSEEVIGAAITAGNEVEYAAGAMLLDPRDPSRVIARTDEPILAPETPDECEGVVANVVFPTAIESVDDVRYVFYGMADTKIGVARLDHTPPSTDL